MLIPITSNEGSASLLQAASLTNHHDSETSGPWDPVSPVSPVAQSLWVETEEAELLLTSPPPEPQNPLGGVGCDHSFGEVMYPYWTWEGSRISHVKDLGFPFPSGIIGLWILWSWDWAGKREGIWHSACYGTGSWGESASAPAPEEETCDTCTGGAEKGKWSPSLSVSVSVR